MWALMRVWRAYNRNHSNQSRVHKGSGDAASLVLDPATIPHVKFECTIEIWE